MVENEIEELNIELDYYQISFNPEDVTSEWHWDPHRKGDSISLSKENKNAMKSQDDKQYKGSVIGNRPASTYQVKFIKGIGDIMVGMAPNIIDVNQEGNHYRYGWFLTLYDGKVWSKSNIKGSAYSGPIAPNSVIQVKYDKENGTISYVIDGQDKGIAHRNISSDFALYPCLEFYDTIV
eukprot:TRINITY_DN856_c2_g1_i2.p1 TRINITY_DN856_c2_g1~~TRINITY_DN856_c2_g1_i2.p1  ORF type:complete len:200 (-),score=42.54 TRINITY_DN856_c2_g1_i2:215-751(-)